MSQMAVLKTDIFLNTGNNDALLMSDGFRGIQSMGQLHP